MKFKRSISILIAVIMTMSAFCVTSFSAVEETEAQTVPAETSALGETGSVETNPAETTVEPETTEPVVTEPEVTQPADEKKDVKPDTKTAKFKVKGSTIKLYNKKLFNAVNVYRKSKGLSKLKNDKDLSAKAYKRALMLAVYYSGKLSAKTNIEFPDNIVYSKGATYVNTYLKFKKCDFKKSKNINACGIANVKVGNVRFWVILADKKNSSDIKKVTAYSKKSKSYSAKMSFYTKYLKAKKGAGNFKNKTVRYKKNKKYPGQLYLTNYKSSVNSFFKVSNLASHTPVKYSTQNDSVAMVSSYGNVKAKQVSAFKERKRYTPKKGDFILFHWYPGDGYLANHVGIVYKVTKKNVITIEGNTKANDYRKSVVSKKTYKKYKRNSEIVGFIDVSQFMKRDQAKKMAELAKKQIGKRGRNFYNHTKAWKEFNGEYMAANWCAIFCGWLLEQNGLEPYDFIRWSPSCTMWIRQCHKRATAKITAKIPGSGKSYSYKVTFKV